MSDLYEQAVLDAKKLRSLAEEEAKREVVKAITPFIKETIDGQIAGVSESFYFEQGDEESRSFVTPDVTDTTGLDDLGTGLGDDVMSAPLDPMNNLGGTTMPDADGKLTVDLEDLFANPEGLAATMMGNEQEVGTMPPQQPQPSAVMDLPPEEEQTPLQEVAQLGAFKTSLLEAGEKVDFAYFNKNLTQIQKESLKMNLFSLLEELDNLKETSDISAKQIKLNESKLEFLFLKLKEAEIHNSYLLNQKEEENIMTTLKEYTAQLFAEDVSAVNQPSTADDKHAVEQSGVSPEVGGPAELKAAADSSVNEETLPGVAGTVDSAPLPGTNSKPPAEKPWDESAAPLDEKDQDKVVAEALDALAEEVEAEGHAGFGPKDTAEKPPVEFEVDEAELCEAIEAIRKESLTGKLDDVEKIKADKGPMEDGTPEGGKDPSHKKLDEMNRPMTEEEDEALADVAPAGLDAPVGDDMDMDMGMGDEMGVDGDDVDADLVLHLDLPDEVEAALAGVDVAALGDVSVSVADVNLGGEDELGGDDMSGAPDLGVEEPALEDEVEEDPFAEKALYEAKLKKAGTALKQYKGQIATYRTELQEANLFIAKNVYFTKFMQRGDLTKENLNKIVEYLDRAKTVKEAKTIYSKIKKTLNESITASTKLAGSSSKVTTPGSAVTLQESKTNESADNTSVDRWKLLAGIKKVK